MNQRSVLNCIGRRHPGFRAANAYVRWCSYGPARPTNSHENLDTMNPGASGKGRCHTGLVEAVVVFDLERMIEPMSVRRRLKAIAREGA